MKHEAASVRRANDKVGEGLGKAWVIPGPPLGSPIMKCSPERIDRNALFSETLIAAA